MDLREAIERIVKAILKPKAVVGTVKAVDANAKTCTVEVEGGYTRYDVRLRADEEGDSTGLYIVPSINSRVVIEMIEGQTGMWYVAMVSTSATICLNGDQYGSLMKIQETVDRINRLENKMNSHINLFNAHIHVTTATVGVGPVGTIAPTTTQDTPITPLTQVTDLENTKVKHG